MRNTFLSLFVVILLSIVPGSSEAKGQRYPFKNTDGSVSISRDAGATQDNRYLDCNIYSVKTIFWGDQPVCQEHAKCRKEIAGAVTDTAIVERGIFDMDEEFVCLGNSNSGCSKKTWQDCDVDDSFPDNFNYKNCITATASTTLPKGCPAPSNGGGINSNQRTTR